VAVPEKSTTNACLLENTSEESTTNACLLSHTTEEATTNARILPHIAEESEDCFSSDGDCDCHTGDVASSQLPRAPPTFPTSLQAILQTAYTESPSAPVPTKASIEEIPDDDDQNKESQADGPSCGPSARVISPEPCAGTDEKTATASKPGPVNASVWTPSHSNSNHPITSDEMQIMAGGNEILAQLLTSSRCCGPSMQAVFKNQILGQICLTPSESAKIALGADHTGFASTGIPAKALFSMVMTQHEF
jgi:hypothetical protein